MIRTKQSGLIALLMAVPLFASAQGASAAPTPATAKVSACSSAGFIPELADLIRSYSQRTGKKFIIDPRVRAMGDVTGVDADKLTYEQLIALGTVHQFVFIPQGDVTLVIPDANARQQATPIYYDLNFKALDDEWVTLLLTGKNVCAAYVVPILRPMMPQAAHLAGNPQSNQILITDRAVNARRIASLFYKLDEAAPAGRRCPDAETNMSKEWGKEPPPKK
jgi:type II secretory pathway component GspD/PulD (secretin)